jgi:S-adenosylmethionine decarboxylase
VNGHAGRTAADMVYGMELVMDIDGCSLAVIKSEIMLRKFAAGMVEAIDMKAYGDPILAHFGHADPVTSGWTLVQLIETSSITAHFSEHLRRAHVNVFSCRTFDVDLAVKYAAGFLGTSPHAGEWGSASVTWTVLYR